MDHREQVALVTGSSRGIGVGVAIAFAKLGVNVVVHCNDSVAAAESVLEEVKSLGVKGMIVKADMKSPAAISNMAKDIVQNMGRIDFLVNNAGIRKSVTLDSLTEPVWDEMIDINLKGTFFCCREFAPIMKAQGSGSIVNIASIGGVSVDKKAPHYAASKAGVIHLTRVLAHMLGPEIRVNSVAPGWIEDAPLGTSVFSDEVINRIKKNTPLKRLGRIEDIAEVVIFLAMSAKFVTGQLVVVDGGVVA